TGPVPSLCRGVQIFAGPLMIEPCLASHAVASSAANDAAAHLQVRLAVVVARRAQRRSFLAEALRAIQQRRTLIGQCQLQREVLGSDARLVDRARTVAVSLQPPVVHDHVGIPRGCLHQSEAGTTHALFLPEPSALRIGSGAKALGLGASSLRCTRKKVT